MGTEIYFRHRLDVQAMCTSMLFDEEDFIEDFGRVHFSAFTQRSQAHVYGIDYCDCITYGPEGDKEQIGAVDSNDIYGWYTPDWDRALVRIEKLMAAWEATTDLHRKEYDAQRLPQYRELIYRCAKHPDRQNCQVQISD